MNVVRTVRILPGIPEETGEKTWTQIHDELFAEKALATGVPGAGDLLLAHYVPNETPMRREIAREVFKRYAQSLVRLWEELYGGVEKSPKSPKSTDWVC